MTGDAMTGDAVTAGTMPHAPTPFRVADGRLSWTGGGETVAIQPWGPDSVRVRCGMGRIEDTDWALLPAARDPDAVRITVDGDVATLVNGRLTVVARASSGTDWQAGGLRHDCRLAFYDADGRLLLQEVPDDGATKPRPRRYRALPGGTYRTTLSLAAADEHLAGLGVYQQRTPDLKGSTFELAQRNCQASVPFVTSTAGYGFLWHDPSVGRVTFGANRTEWESNATRQIDYWVTAGDTPAAIVRHYADATGHVPMMPELGLGYWQCKMRYASQEELLEVAREHRRRGLPLDVIVADFFHWPHMGDYRFEEEFWPDPQAMVDELREMGVELMVSVWPQVALDSVNFPAMDRRNLLVATNRGIDVQMWFGGPSRFVDATNPEARQFLWEQCRQGYGRYGIRLFWLDEAEPEFGKQDWDAWRFHAGQGDEVANLYPQHFSRAFYEGLRADGVEDVVNLVRCAWAGSQRYGALMWSGDIASTFESLRRQLTAGVHLGVAGIPWFTTDIGGFWGARTDDPAFHELVVRWFQAGTFMPVMRMHGTRLPEVTPVAADGTPRQSTGAPNEVWSFGEETYRILARYLHLREALRDYTRELMRQAHTDGQPVMRGLFYEFPGDDRCWGDLDEYLYGPDLLVAPVVQAGATSRSVYLPAGARWTELHSGAVHDGGQDVTVDAPLDVIPVFARDGRLAHLVGRL